MPLSNSTGLASVGSSTRMCMLGNAHFRISLFEFHAFFGASIHI
jgi:hypothetical protein